MALNSRSSPKRRQPPRIVAGLAIGSAISWIIGAPAPTRAAAQTGFHLDASALVLRILSDSQGSLSGAIRKALADSLPDPLAESSPGWGHTVRIGHSEKKQGQWRRMEVHALNPRDTLVLDIRDVHLGDKGAVAMTVFLACDARIIYTEHVYEAGIRLLASSVRARARLRLRLECDCSAGLESGSALLPDAVIGIHVRKAAFGYDSLVFEHAAGVGGEAAKVLGESLHKAIRELKPGLEANLLAKADAAIIKTGKDREVRLSLSRLLKETSAKGALPSK